MIAKSKINNDKGVVLLMVLSTIFIVVILANVVLTLIASQSRLTHHQVSRIQAYYAAQAGMNLAFENLRTGTWGTGTYALCPTAANCPAAVPAPNRVIDGDIPFPVTIAISAPDATGRRTLNLTANYIYTP